MGFRELDCEAQALSRLAEQAPEICAVHYHDDPTRPRGPDAHQFLDHLAAQTLKAADAIVDNNMSLQLRADELESVARGSAQREHRSHRLGRERRETPKKRYIAYKSWRDTIAMRWQSDKHEFTSELSKIFHAARKTQDLARHTNQLAPGSAQS